MKYREVLALKESLRDNRFTSTAGNTMRIIIAPADKEALETWKKGMPHIWNQQNPDILARYYTQEDDFILFGVRMVKEGVFSGGILDLRKHSELIHRRKPDNSRDRS
jgi:hypothetical protein